MRTAVIPIVLGALLAPATDAAAARAMLLSDERTRTYWAHAEYRAPAVKEPKPGAKRLTRLHLNTEDGLPEVYVVLRRLRDDAGRRWFNIRIPGRKAPQKAWVRATALGPLHLVKTRLVVNRAKLRAILYRDGEPVLVAPVGIGKPGTPTPKGTYWIREGFPVQGDGIYGAYAFGTSAYSDTLTDWPGGGVVGIHGTNQPGLIPGRPSHGCIRMRNGDIRRLAKRMPVGTPLLVR